MNLKNVYEFFGCCGDICLPIANENIARLPEFYLESECNLKNESPHKSNFGTILLKFFQDIFRNFSNKICRKFGTVHCFQSSKYEFPTPVLEFLDGAGV
ncbi:MAG: hypothetical protein ACI9PY_003170 [Ascidiaceihabitans sp.]